MKEYTVYFIIKKNHHGYILQEVVTANNQKEAFAKVKYAVQKYSKRHAFQCSCKKPEIMKDGLFYNNILYTHYNELFNRLW